MTGKQNNRHTNSEKRTTWAPSVFINQELTSDQRRALKEQEFGAAEFDKHVGSLLDKGYKVTCSVDGKYQCYAAFAIPISEDNPNKGYILTGRGSSPLKAVKQLMFKVLVIYDSGPWDLGNNWGGEEIDD